MTSHAKRKTTGKKSILFTFLIGAVAVGMLACGANYGNLKYADEVKQTFESYKVLPDYRYYYSGSDAYPDVIIGIQKEYQLKSELWKPVDLTAEQLKNWLNFPRQRVGYDQNRRGSHILGPAGETIGVYYANQDWRVWSSVKLEGDNLVVVSSPARPRNAPGASEDPNGGFGSL
jgi:hypothetical protein